MMRKVVVIEDEKHMIDMLQCLLEKNAYEVEIFASAEEFLMNHRDQAPKIFLVDSKLPGIQGADVVKTIRYKDKISPVIMVSGQLEDQEILRGLEAGADDYVTKPFNPDHLIAKVRNASKKSSTLAQELNVQGLQLLPEAQAFIKNGVTVSLTSREYRILEALAKLPNEILTRDDILTQFDDIDLKARNIDVHIFSLRKKIQKAGMGVETIRGQGYRLVL